jgi:hypothetical protein
MTVWAYAGLAYVVLFVLVLIGLVIAYYVDTERMVIPERDRWMKR